MNTKVKTDVSTWLFVSRIKTNGDELVEYKTVEISPTSEMTMEALPIEVLTHILQYLSPIDRIRSEQVCKKWRDASRHTWRDVQMLHIIKPLNGDYYCRFRNRYNFHELVEKEDNRLFIGSDSPKIIRCLISRVGYFVKKLIFNYSFSRNFRVIVSDINNYCHNLEFLGIGIFNGGDDDELFSRLFEGNKKLHSLQFFHSFYFIEVLPLRNWKSLHLGLCKTFHEAQIVSLIEHSEALEEFGMTDYTARIVEALLKRRHLKSLSFCANEKVSLKMIFDVSLLNRLTKLRIFHDKRDLQILCNILQHCCQLKRLEIIADSHNAALVKLLKAIQALPVLETLNLSLSSITDDMLIHLINVRNLCLIDDSKHLTNNGILRMIKKSEVLEKLNIEKTDVTPRMFTELMEEMSDRHKHLEVMVHEDIYDSVYDICEDSKIRVVKDMECFGDWNVSIS